MPNKCDVCSKTQGVAGLGGMMFCRTCYGEVREEIDALRANDKPVDCAIIAHRLRKERNLTTISNLRDFPADLWTEAKHRALDEGISARELVIRAVRLYLDTKH